MSGRAARRGLAAGALAAVLVLAAAHAQRPWTGEGIGAAAPAPAPAAAAREVASVGMTVSDLERSVDFYARVLGFRVLSTHEAHGPELEALTGVFGARVRVARLQLGEERLELTEFLASPGRPAPADQRSNDRWFQHVAIIVSDMDSAYAVLRAHRVRHASTGPQTLPPSIPAAAGIRAFYFRDPDGHPLEILQFPPDKGAARWQARHALFLGIDHTAIVVAGTATSARFWGEALGFARQGESRNAGTEQAHLNNVRDARLRITGWRVPAGPGVEFLEYEHPRDGRPLPRDARPNDLIHWQTTLVVDALDTALARALAAGGQRLSERIASDPAARLGWRRAVLVRDPDGHAVQLIER